MRSADLPITYLVSWCLNLIRRADRHATYWHGNYILPESGEAIESLRPLPERITSTSGRFNVPGMMPADHQRTYFGMAVTFPVNFGVKAAIRLSVRSSPYHLLEMADTSGPSEVSWAPNLLWYDYHLSHFARNTNHRITYFVMTVTICLRVMRRSPHHLL